MAKRVLITPGPMTRRALVPPVSRELRAWRQARHKVIYITHRFYVEIDNFTYLSDRNYLEIN